MPDPNLRLLEEAAIKLAPFLQEIVFVGGVTLGLLITDKAAAPIRSTDDVDVIADIIIEDIVMGALPWIPKVNFHNPFLSPDVGGDFMEHFHRAVVGKSNPFILVMEGSVPDETNKEEI